MRYYFMINVGALIGQITMVYAEKYVGFWLSYTLPTILFLLCPIVMILCRKRYARLPPTGSVLGKSVQLITYGIKKNGIGSINKDYFWTSIRPSQVEQKPKWMTFDDAWADQVRRGLSACAVFTFYPIFWLAYGQMSSNMINMAATVSFLQFPIDLDRSRIFGEFFTIFGRVFRRPRRSHYHMKEEHRLTISFDRWSSTVSPM